MPPQKEDLASRIPDKDGYYRLGQRTFVYLLLKECLLAIAFLLIEVMLIAASAGGNSLPPFSELVSADGSIATIVRYLETIVPFFVIIAGLFGATMAIVSYKSFRYKIESNSLSLVTGIVSRRKVSLPFSQMQNVDLEQGFIHRVFGLVNLVILSRGHADPKHTQIEDNELIMPRLTLEEGQRLHAFLLEHLNASNQGGSQYSP